jgi:rhamnosyltransferase subunit B
VRALRSGTPQVILAHGADRPDNAARLARHGLARWLPEERWDPAAIAAELAAAMTDAGLGPRAARLLDEPEDAAPDRAARALLALLDAPPPAPGAAPPPPAAGDAPVRSVRELTPEQRRLLLRRLAAGPR